MSLDAELLNRIAPLRIKAAQLIDALPAGIHPSHRSGQSLDPSDPRLYQPGDELRHIDWRASGKRDHLYVRRYAGERQMRVGLLIDVSPSMSYRYRVSRSKKFVAVHLAAVLIHLLHAQGDAVGLGIYAPDQLRILPPHRSPDHQEELFDRLESALQEEDAVTGEADGSSLLRALQRSGEQMGPVDSWIILGDLLDEDPSFSGLNRELQMLHSRQQEVTLFQVLERATELDFRFDDEEVLFEDLETGESMDVGRSEWMEQSRREAALRQAQWRSLMATAGVGWIEMDTAFPVFDPIHRWVDQRASRSGR